MLSSYVATVSLPDAIGAPQPSKRCFATGWGTVKYQGALPDVLQEVAVYVVSEDNCNDAYPGDIDDTMMCAGKSRGGSDACQGDSGGPLVCKESNKFYLQGVTSWGNECGLPQAFGIFAKVKNLLPWIRANMV